MQKINEPNLLSIVAAIKASSNEWGGWSHQNSQLELASMALEVRACPGGESAALLLAPLWFKQAKATRKRPGVFARSPGDVIANSHDNWIGLSVCSYLFDYDDDYQYEGSTAKEILDQGLTAGLWLTGKNEHGYWLDGEWFNSWRPLYKGLMKLGAGRKITWLEKLEICLNLRFSDAYNVVRVNLLFCELVKDELGWVAKHLPYFQEKLSDRYKARYGDNPIYKGLWELNGSGYDMSGGAK